MKNARSLGAVLFCKIKGGKNMQSKKGISLIVLVITIIVMIILAAAIIISLNNTGIIGNANKAKEESNLANIKTAADLIYSDYILDESVLPDGTTIGDYITDKLVNNGIIKGKDSDYYIVVNNSVTSVIKVGSLADKYYKGEVKIGDYVSYDAGNNEITASEYSGDQCLNNGTAKDVTIKSSKDLKWQVIGANGSKVLLVSEKSIAPYKPNETSNSKKGFSLYGAYSYLKGEEMLDNACSVFGNGYGAEKARNIKIEDVEKIIGDKKSNYVFDIRYWAAAYENFLGINYGREIIYDGKTQYTVPYYHYYGEEGYKIFKMLDGLTFDKLKHPDLDSENYVKEKVVTLKQTGYSYEQKEELTDKLKLIFDSSIGDYYLSSKSQDLSNNGVEYGIFTISKGKYLDSEVLYLAGHINYNEFFCSDDDNPENVEGEVYYNLRPIIELKENIMCEKSDTVWNLK